jgi:DNA-binding NtrC family response regulator
MMDDNTGDVRLVREMLEDGNEPYTLKYVKKLSSGLESLSKGNVDVIILDLKLSDSKYLYTLQSVCKDTSEIPIVVYTAFNDLDVAVCAIKMGAQDYLIKGEINSTQLRNSLRFAIERKHMANELKSYSELLKEVLEEKTSTLS